MPVYPLKLEQTIPLQIEKTKQNIDNAISKLENKTSREANKFFYESLLRIQQRLKPNIEQLRSIESNWIVQGGNKRGKQIWDDIVQLLNLYYYYEYLRENYKKDDLDKLYYMDYASQNVSANLFKYLNPGDQGKKLLEPPYVALFGQFPDGTFQLYRDPADTLIRKISLELSRLTQIGFKGHLVLFGGMYFRNGDPHQVLFYIDVPNRTWYLLEPGYNGNPGILNQQFLNAVNNFVLTNFPGYTFSIDFSENPTQCSDHENMCTPLSVLGYKFKQDLTFEHAKKIILNFLENELSKLDTSIRSLTNSFGKSKFRVRKNGKRLKRLQSDLQKINQI